ncbi:MAG: thiazole synthase [Rickettsiales bacterium]
MLRDDPLLIAGRSFSSRLLVGTGKYKDMRETKAAIEASGAQIVTAALRRVNVNAVHDEKLHDAIDPQKYTYLPNTAGCYTAEEALRTLRLARELGGWNLVKLEVIGDRQSLLPNMEETLKAMPLLVQDGFDVMVYTLDDAAICQALEARGARAIMPLAAPIGSGLGITNPSNIRRIVEQSKVPVIVDAGIGCPSDAVQAMELGCAGVLMNTAIAEAQNPIQMAQAMRRAVEAGRLGYLAGRMAKRDSASASSPMQGII